MKRSVLVTQPIGFTALKPSPKGFLVVTNTDRPTPRNQPREPKAINHSQQILEVKPIDYSPATTPPVEPKAVAVESDKLTF